MATKAKAKRGAVTEPARGQARDLLLSAASDLMKERDSLKLSLSELATRAQVNSALVKYYFGNKHGLLVALLERDLALTIAQLEHLVEVSMSPARKMRAHITGMVKIFHQYPYLNRLTMALMHDVKEEREAREVADRFLRPICEAYEKLINEGVDAGLFKKVDPKLFFFSVIGACDQIFSALYVLRYVHGIEEIDDSLRRAYARHTTTLLMDGLLAKT